jgi:predicted RNase H-like nuclease (RuvC/YqgF family)
MTDNAELMQLRGEYVTLQSELRDLQQQVADEAKFTYEWASKVMSYANSNNPVLGKFPEINEADVIINRIRRIQEKHDQAEEIRARLIKLKPMTGL